MSRMSDYDNVFLVKMTDSTLRTVTAAGPLQKSGAHERCRLMTCKLTLENVFQSVPSGAEMSDLHNRP